jgi:hypothetical protein
LPGLLLGLWASGQVARLLDERWLRPTILAFAAVTVLAIVGFVPKANYVSFSSRALIARQGT